MNFLPENIIALCKARKISLEELAEIMAISEARLNRIADRQEVAYPDELIALSIAFSRSIDSILKNNYSLITSTQPSAIKLLILDVDGVMTDGGMNVSESGDEWKRFDTKDGRGIIELQKKSSIQVGIISSGRKSEAIVNRAQRIGVTRVYVGLEPKMDILQRWCKDAGISLHEVAFIGDDVNDLPVLKEVGISACPADAVQKVKDVVHIILEHRGGHGCIREFIEQWLNVAI